MLKLHKPLQAQRAPLNLRRVLIVDDNREAADMLGAMLVFLGYDVRVVYDSEMGLEEAASFDPDVAIWDISLPGIDGYEAARRLRKGDEGQKIQLIALSALSTPEDALAALAAGFDRHMKKPVDVNALLAELGCA